jgi:predicted lipoprotein with Yx(FWY)xxD motif
VRRLLLLNAVFVSAILLACGADSEEEGGSASTPAATSAAPTGAAATATAAAATGTQVKVIRHATLGSILADADGKVLYVFGRDEKGKSNCAGNCAQTWPLLKAGGTPRAGEGAQASLISTIRRDDGETQVTYNGLPLYYYAADQKPGDANGQNVGSIWWVVSPGGEAVKEAPAAASSTESPPTEPGY